MRDRIGDRGLMSDDRRRIVSFQENQKEYKAHNTNNRRVLRYRIDGQMITTSTCCDFGMGIPSIDTFYLIELKGTNLKKAVRQILSTLDALQLTLKEFTVHSRVVLRRIQRPNLLHSDVIKLKKRLAESKGTLKYKCMVFEETI